MRIVDIKITEESIPLKTPFITALRRVDAAQFIQVKLRTDDGLCGIGEAPPTKAITGEDMESITSTIRDSIAPRLFHRPFQSMDEAQVLLHESCKGNSSAKAAIDIALYDLFSQQAGQPLYAYLGGSEHPVKTDVTISLNDPQTMAADAGKAVKNGFDILKVKVGAKDGKDIERIRAVRKAVPEASLLIDANQAWNETETLEVIEAIGDLNITLIEQPVPAEQLESMQCITTKSSIPILADESVFTLEDAKKAIETKAANMINIKLMKCGGIYKAIEVIRLCEANGIECMLGSMLEGPTSIAAAAHLAMVYPRTICCLDLDSPLLYRSVPKKSPVIFRGNRLITLSTKGITGNI